MIIYLIEVAILNLLFYSIYKLLLSKETQLGFLRTFIVGSTALSLFLPALELPSLATIPTIDMGAIMLPAVEANLQNTDSTLPWYVYLYVVIGSLFLIKFLVTLGQIYGWYKQSEKDALDSISIRKVPGLQNSFTFFQWIFIDPRNFENPSDIIRHELGHAKKLHSVDLIFFYSLTILFWWLPSIWLFIKELKSVHEYQADQFALELSDQTYTKTLVHCTLKAHGMNLASSFDDAPIFNRLNFMKKMKKKISFWKVASITALVATSGALFACEEELESEIGRITEESSQQITYSNDVKAALDKLQSANPDQEYVVIETKMDNKESISKLQSYDPEQIEHVFVNKGAEEGEGSITMIVNQSSDLFKKTVEVQKLHQDEVFTIVEKTAMFPGGKEAFFNYLIENMKYPEQAQKLGVEGNVFVLFIVQTDGSITDAQVVRGIGAGCDQIALDVIKNSPKWTPAEQDGKKVAQKLIQKLSFKMPS